MNLDDKVEISRLIIQHAAEKYPRIFVACSFGKDSRIVVDLALQVKPDIEFFGIDTGYEFPETLDFAEELVRETGMRFRWLRPSEDARRKIDAEYGDSFIKKNQYNACKMKIPATRGLLFNNDAGIRGWGRNETKNGKTPRWWNRGRSRK